ncbi:ATP-binding protein [Nocardia terpenica]|uniref:ATP-binding protein n=1 Tax=Nocardia terpenica TaxID=455432 RepID=UPI000AF799AB|nr:ATP-binding protein [Nocardia terpenica]
MPVPAPGDTTPRTLAAETTSARRLSPVGRTIAAARATLSVPPSPTAEIMFGRPLPICRTIGVVGRGIMSLAWVRAAERALGLGCRSARVLAVEVSGPSRVQAAARRARYAALDAARDGLPVLLGHTLDDQAETVLLGLGRGSGGRSLRGMAEFADPWGRPLLGVRRDVTRRLCADLGLTPYEDPHNSAPEFTRVRLRTEVLPLLEEVLGGGVAPALARTAEQLRADGAVLDELAERLLHEADDGSGLSIETLATAPAALRLRAVRAWLLAGGAKALTDKHLRAVDALVTDWHGQGGVAVGGGTPGTRLVATRKHGRLTLGLAP